MAKDQRPNQFGLNGWVPSDRQALALACPVYELFFGGAKGGGKTDFLLYDFVNHLKYGEDYAGIIFRKTYKELEEVMRKAERFYPSIGGEWNKGDLTWTFPAGSTLRFRHLESNADVQRYQGHEYQWIGFDEVTEFFDDYCYIFAMSFARSSKGVPVRIRATGNPGRPGHLWVKARFINVSEPETPYQDAVTGLYRMFIPSRLEDNPGLNESEYEAVLKNLPPHLYRAFRYGDWSVFVGQAFEEFDYARHVVSPHAIEPQWFRFASMDWGYAKPFSIGWWAITPLGRMIRYREWYGCMTGQPNTGIQMEATKVAEDSWKMSVAEGCDTMVADPSVWNKSGTGSSIAEIFSRAGWKMVKGVNDRVNGLGAIHDRLKVESTDGLPMMIVFDTCTDWIRTVPSLPVDDKNPEDVNTKAEDHAYDDTRYACMSTLSHKRVRQKKRPRYEGAWDEDEQVIKDYDPY